VKHKIARQNRFGTIDISQLVIAAPDENILLGSELEAAVLSAVEAAAVLEEVELAEQGARDKHPTDELPLVNVPETTEEEVSTSPDSAVGCWSVEELAGREQRDRSVSPGELPLVRVKAAGNRASSRPPRAKSSGTLKAVSSPTGEEIVDPVWLDEPTRIMSPEQLDRELEMDERRQLVELAL